MNVQAPRNPFCRVANIVIRDRLREVRKECEHRRSHGYLSPVFDLHSPPTVMRRWLPPDQLLEHLVHLVCLDAASTLVVDLEDGVEAAPNPLSGQGRGEDDRYPLKEGDPSADFLFPLRSGHRVLLDQIPLVGDQDQGTPGLPRHLSDPHILGVKLFLARVDQQNANLRRVDDPIGPQGAVILDTVLHTCLTSQPRRIDEDDAAAVITEFAVDGVTGGTGDLRHNRPVLADQPVHEAGFPHVGFSDHRHADGVVFRVKIRSVGQPLQNQIQEIA